VAYERNKSAQIARNMIVSESVNLPLRPALDMREKDKLYEVRFSMPQESDESDVNIELNGNILTMVLDAEDKTFMKRIRIPCDYAHDSVLKHFVSNQVLHVQITKSAE
jgi:HSP20 family molecular chaperone IbpA